MIGILGGTFDPVHNGHLHLALETAGKLGLEKVLLVPLHLPPHRQPPVAGDADRRDMLAAAIAGNPRLELDGRELDRGGTSYTADTLAALSDEYPQACWCLILGGDAFADFAAWHEPRRIARMCNFAVAARPGAGDERVRALPYEALGLRLAGSPDELRRSAAGAVWINDIGAPDISASEVRRLLAAGGRPDGMVPAAVLDLIEQRGLYGRQS